MDSSDADREAEETIYRPWSFATLDTEDRTKKRGAANENHTFCRICPSHFKGWLVYVETLLDYGVNRVPLYPHFHS
jgi:hypothetical protein